MKTYNPIKNIKLILTVFLLSSFLTSCGDDKEEQARKQREKYYRESRAQEQRYYQERQRQRDHETGMKVIDTLFGN